MKTLIIKLDDQIAAWAKDEAARSCVSLSQYIGQVLSSHMHGAGGYDEAMSRFLSRKPVMLKRSGEAYPSRG